MITTITTIIILLIIITMFTYVGLYISGPTYQDHIFFCFKL